MYIQNAHRQKPNSKNKSIFLILLNILLEKTKISSYF
jgi:hypothetical protein